MMCTNILSQPPRTRRSRCTRSSWYGKDRPFKSNSTDLAPKKEDPDNPPDLVIGGKLYHFCSHCAQLIDDCSLKADTVVLSHLIHAAHGAHESLLPQERPEILEKPISKADNLRMLLDLNGASCEVVTGVSLGASSSDCAFTQS